MSKDVHFIPEISILFYGPGIKGKCQRKINIFGAAIWILVAGVLCIFSFLVLTSNLDSNIIEPICYMRRPMSSNFK